MRWHHDRLRAHLETAAQTHATLVLDLGASFRTVAVSSVLKRGSSWMVLGDDADDASSVALPLTSIRRLGEPAPASTAATKVPAPPMRWRPEAGAPPPVGHFSCPCGSRAKYRNCCREPTSG